MVYNIPFISSLSLLLILRLFKALDVPIDKKSPKLSNVHCLSPNLYDSGLPLTKIFSCKSFNFIHTCMNF